MSTLTLKEVQKIAELSKLHFSENEIGAFTDRLDNILTFVEKMNSINTDQIEPLAHPFNATQPMRADTVTEDDQRDLFQKNAPRVEAGLYIVPKFVESE